MLPFVPHLPCIRYNNPFSENIIKKTHTHTHTYRERENIGCEFNDDCILIYKTYIQHMENIIRITIYSSLSLCIHTQNYTQKQLHSLQLYTNFCTPIHMNKITKYIYIYI